MEIYKESIKIMKNEKYREANKETMKEYQKNYREKNRKKKEPIETKAEYNKKIISCDKCGTYIQQQSLSRHKKTMICRKMWDSSLLDSEDEE